MSEELRREIMLNLVLIVKMKILFHYVGGIFEPQQRVEIWICGACRTHLSLLKDRI